LVQLPYSPEEWIIKEQNTVLWLGYYPVGEPAVDEEFLWVVGDFRVVS
jgi:hypothetical protein